MTPRRRPGQPLAVLLTLLGAWAVVRIAIWQSPFALTAVPALAQTVEAPARLLPREPARAGEIGSRVERAGLARPADRAPAPVLRMGSAISNVSVIAAQVVGEVPERGALRRPQRVAQQAIPASAPPLAFPPPSSLPGRRPLAADRFTGNAWLLWRAGPSAPRAAPGARYGGSQAGVLVQVALSPDGRRPALYARTSAALDTLADRELAAGFSARPVAAVPARLQAELRARQAGGSVRLAPAAMAVSELSPQPLGLGFRAEPYLAAGYVGGRDATPFVDGALRIDRPVAGLGPFEARAGAGAWGGAQKGASALDVGPQVSLRGTLGALPLTVALDYRVRVAGDARPRAGPALTISTGF